MNSTIYGNSTVYMNNTIYVNSSSQRLVNSVMKHNLLSISQLCDKGFKVIFESSHCINKDSQNDKIIFIGQEMKMFILLIFQNMKAIIDVFLACIMRVGCGIGDWDM